MPQAASEWGTQMQRIFMGITLAALAAVVTVQSASAGGFAIREQSARGQGMSFAGAAAGGGGLGSMFWNPAIITQYNGWQTQSNATLIVPTAKIQMNGTVPALPFATNAGNITQGAVVPASYMSYQWNDKIWLGISTNSRFGLVTKYPYNGNWQTAARSSKVFSVSFNPTIAYKVNQFLSVAAGISVEYFKVRLTGATAIAPNAPSLILQGDAWSVGYTFGATITPLPGTTIGIGYRSQMRPKLGGSVANFPAVGATTGIQAGLVLPQQVTIGLRQRLSKKFTLLAGVEWTNWSVFNRFPVTSTGPFAPGAQLAPLTLAFQWRDGWFASVGGEYKWNDKLTIRSGLGYEWSPITNANRGLRLPDQSRWWLSAGLSYKWSEQLSFDLGYTRLIIPKTQINIAPGNPTFNPFVPIQYFATARAHFDIISVGVNYKFGHKAPAVVAKY